MCEQVNTYLDELAQQRRLSPHTVSNYRRDLNVLCGLIAGLPGSVAIDAVQTHHIRRFIAQLHSRELGGRSLARMLSAWRGFYRWLGQRGEAILNPVDGVRPGGTEANADFRTDFWLLKLDESGNKVWDQTFGGSKEDYAKSVVETSDKGLALAGYTQSKGSGDRGSNRSFWVIKTDSQGTLLWDNTYGESHFDVATSICTTPDDGLAVAGYTKSEGVVNNDILVFKLAADGTKLWSKKMGSLDTEEANCLIKMYDGNLAVAAYSKSTKIEKSNFWLITLDHETGRDIQNEKFERGSLDYSMAIIQTYDKGLVMAGSTYYFADHLGWQMAVLKFQNDNRPGITFMQPKYKETLVQHDYFSLKIVFSSSTPLKQVDLFIDDKLVKTFPDFSDLEIFKKSGYETTLKMNLPLHKGNNNFRIVAENLNGITKSEVYNFHNEKLPLIRW